MGASPSGLLDEAKISNIKGLVDGTFQSFSVFYRQQYSAAYFRHLHQEVEPKKEGRGLLLTHTPQYAPQEVLYQGGVRFSCWDEQGKKCRERHTVLRRDYKVEIHENIETFSRGCAAKLVLQPAGASVFTTEEESRAHLEQTCAGILNGVKEDSSSVVSSPDVFAVYLHLPYAGHTCFLFQQEEERDHFRSALKTCIRHCNLDPWSDSSYESQAFARALRLYRQDKGCYESWEMLLGTEEQVLASQVMEEALPWLQTQLQPRVRGKKTERIRQWLATVQATYALVLDQLAAGLEALRAECRQTASANQALIRSNLDQIMSSHRFLQERVGACIREEAEKVCGESVAPYMSSILEALAENISAGIRGMQHTLHVQMDSAFTHTRGGTEETKEALSTLRSISLEQCYRQAEKLTEKLAGLKQRFGLGSAQRLVHSAHLEMEKLLDSAVYTLELFLRPSAGPPPSQIPVRMERAKERVLKQLDHDSRVVQRRLYQEALLEITLPALTRRMDSRWKTELQQFEQYIFSDYSSFILVHNVYDDVLRDIPSKEIETVVQDAASKKSNNLLLDTSDLGFSQYSLLGVTPPRSAPGSPALRARDSPPAAPREEPVAAVEGAGQPVTANVCLQNDPAVSCDQADPGEEPVAAVEGAGQPVTANVCLQNDPAVSCDQADPGEEPVAAVEGAGQPAAANVCLQNDPAVSCDQADPGEEPVAAVEGAGQPAAANVCLQNDLEVSGAEADPGATQSSKLPSPMIVVTQQFDGSSAEEASRFEDTREAQLRVDTPSAPDSDPHGAGTPADPESMNPIPGSADLSMSPPSSPQSTDVPAECAQSGLPATPERSDRVTEDATALQHPCPSSPHPPCTGGGPMKISLGSLSEAIGRNSAAPPVTQTTAQRTTDKAVYLTGDIKDSWEVERGVAQTGGEPVDKGSQSSESPAENASAALTAERRRREETVDDEEKGSELETGTREEDEEEAEEMGDPAEKGGEKEKEEVLQSPRPMESQPERAAGLPLDSVAVIRELVTEITEVETAVSPCPNSSHTP
ncbi:protein Niban 1-like [Enoplosus armatus]|uniref:protein Niban 1-like n=1 Tax=Enoplosus armatus TaxID=215367 RepID=UPI0039916B5D